MNPFFQIVLETLKEKQIPYILGADSLVGFHEGDPVKYSHHLKLYLFPIGLLKLTGLIMGLLGKRILMKPKREQGHLFFKIRSRRDPLKKDPVHIRILPLRSTSGGFEVFLGGQDAFFAATDLSPDQRSFIPYQNQLVSIPNAYPEFIEKYQSELMLGFYQKHVVAFDSKSEKEAVRFMHQNVSLMNQVGIQFWIEGGTLLGALRDQKLIPWDHDLDFGMVFKSEAEMRRLIRTLRRKFYVSVRDFPKTSTIWQLGKYRVLKIFPRKYIFFKKDLCLDLFVYYEGQLPDSTETVYKYVVWDRNAYHRKEFLDNPGQLEFYGKPVPVPATPEKFIEVKYGESWRTPIKEWNVALDDGSIYREA